MSLVTMKLDAAVVRELTIKAIERFVVAPSGHKVGEIKQESNFNGAAWIVTFESIETPAIKHIGDDVNLPLRPRNIPRPAEPSADEEIHF